MSNRYVRKGDSIRHTPANAVANNDIVVVGDLVGVAQGAIASGVAGDVAIEGTFMVPKVAGAIAQGARLHYDASADAFRSGANIADAGDVNNAAVALAAAGAAAEEVEARLTPDRSDAV